MFERIRRARPLLMGLAIVSVVFYHTPFSIGNPWGKLVHDCLYCGVDVFLFLSGIGAVHSIARRGYGDYLRQRVRRLLPFLLPFLLIWSLAMVLTGQMDLPGFLGSVTLLGWFLGSPVQLNWYFSAVWVFFLLAGPVCRWMERGRPVWVFLGLSLLSLALGVLCPLDYLMPAVARLPIFLTGVLFGTLERRGFSQKGLLTGVCLGAMVPGIGLILYTFWGPGEALGYDLGLWWYPFLLTTPGAMILLAALFAFLGKYRPLRVCGRLLSHLGTCSAEILMVQVGTYKLLSPLHISGNRRCLLLMVLCILGGCLWHGIVEAAEKYIKKLRQRY